MVHYDIVGSLPLELLINVVERLDVADIVRSQRVRIARVDARKSILGALNRC